MNLLDEWGILHLVNELIQIGKTMLIFKTIVERN